MQYHDCQAMMKHPGIESFVYPLSDLNAARTFRVACGLGQKGKKPYDLSSLKINNTSVIEKFMVPLMEIKAFVGALHFSGHSIDNAWEPLIDHFGGTLFKGNISDLVGIDALSLPTPMKDLPSRSFGPRFEENKDDFYVNGYKLLVQQVAVNCKSVEIVETVSPPSDDLELKPSAPVPTPKKFPTLVVSDVFKKAEKGVSETGAQRDVRILQIMMSLLKIVRNGKALLFKWVPQQVAIADKTQVDMYYLFQLLFIGRFVRLYGHSRMHNGELLALVSNKEILPEGMQVKYTHSMVQKAVGVVQKRMSFGNAARNYLLLYGLPSMDVIPPSVVFAMRFYPHRLRTVIAGENIKHMTTIVPDEDSLEKLLSVVETDEKKEARLEREKAKEAKKILKKIDPGAAVAAAAHSKRMAALAKAAKLN